MKRRYRANDDGVTLVLVLILVTIVVTIMGAVVSQVTTNLASTVNLRDQTSSNYAADAAGQAAIAQLSNGKFDCSHSTPATVNFGSAGSAFYMPASTRTGPLNASVSCTPDTGVGTSTTTTGSGTMVGSTNTPPAALITVGLTAADGVQENGNWTLCVQNGSIVSYADITGSVSAGISLTGSLTLCPNLLSALVKVQAALGCAGLNLLPTPCTTLPTPLPPVPTVPDPGLAVTGANTNQGAICQTAGSTIYAAFLPGKYTLLTSSTQSSLSTPCQNSKGKWVAADVDWFTPGVYYFDYGSTSWDVPNTTIGGTPVTPAGVKIANLDGTNATTLGTSTLSNLSQAAFPGACMKPTAQTNNGGVEFVFGGSSTLTVPDGGSKGLDICAQYSANSFPVAIYGANKAGLPVSQESGCVVNPVKNCAGEASLLVGGSPNGHETFYIDGYVWAPGAAIEMTYKNSSGQIFSWGLVVRTFQITGNGSSPSGALISLPASNLGLVTTTTYSIRYVNVWICPASTTACPQTGPPNVRVKLQTSGTTWQVLSWSHQH